jgi:hypothetical protein
MVNTSWNSPLQWRLAAIFTLVSGLTAGCSQADDPKIADAPVPPKVEDTSKPETTKSKLRNYEDNPKYQKRLERRFGKSDS